MKAIRYAGAAVCLALAAYFMAPLVMGILHIGMVYPAALLALAAAMLLRPRWFRRLPRWLRRTGGALLGAGLALLAAVLVMMAVQAGNRPGPEDCTVVVLGCQVSANGEPTVMLRDRIDAAYDYLTAHPESRCVASGGQNDNEPISEAACIRDTLTRTASCWRTGPGPRRRICASRRRSSGSRGLTPGWPSHRIIFTSCGPRYGPGAAAWRRSPWAAPAGGPWVRAIGPGRPWPWWCWRLGVCCRGRSAGADKSRPPQRLGDKRITASPGRTTCPPVFWHFYGNKASVMT